MTIDSWTLWLAADKIKIENAYVKIALKNFSGWQEPIKDEML